MSAAGAQSGGERGLVVGSRYRLESKLGEGGMAVVWRAVHTETDRVVALKLVRAELVKEQAVRDMFVREARIGARIGKSEHIVEVLDAGLDEALLVPFIAMELLDGEPLDARLKGSGPLDPVLAAELLEQLADGLDQAHTAGVFHRDLKPQNLFLSKDRKGKTILKVLDYGIAKLAESATQSSTHVGTPAYSAPEQLGASWRTIAQERGKAIAAQVSGATDVWALGLIAFEMLTAAPSGVFWGAETLAELPVKIVLEPLPSAFTRASARASLLPASFQTWIARCLDLDATRRFATAGEAVAALAPALRAPRPASVAPPAAVPMSPSHNPGRGSVPSGTPWQAPTQPQPHDAPVMNWAAARSAELRAPGDARTILAWQPFFYLPRIERSYREARVNAGASVTLIEAGLEDAFRKAVSEDRMLVALVESPKLRYRGSLRSKKSSGGLIDGVGRGLRMLDALAAVPHGILGDPHFEQYFEVTAPSAGEAQMAIPVPLRALLVRAGFHGIVELRTGGALFTIFDAPRFEPPSLDRALDLAARIVAALP
ncbi:MAG: serine/threonine protein kinase [Polyangiaceae bacterium]|nr:serine/threonine protein kinase [Polyangiaceae bacterium]